MEDRVLPVMVDQMSFRAANGCDYMLNWIEALGDAGSVSGV